jgi:hypothetical protein
MKTLPYLIVLMISITACHDERKKKNAVKTVDAIAQVAKKDTVLPDDKNTVVIQNDYGDTVAYTKGKLRQILRHYPELNEEALPPDWAFAKAELEDREFDDQFRSELGQDNYYQLYAYFHKIRHDKKKYQVERKTLINLYNDINYVFRRLTHGGTYFGHQDARIEGYVEYDLQFINEYQKEFDISKQKGLYINTLKQIVNDEMTIDADTPENEKPKLKSDLFKTVNEIDSLITNYFYLKTTQRFQYLCY